MTPESFCDPMIRRLSETEFVRTLQKSTKEEIHEVLSGWSPSFCKKRLGPSKILLWNLQNETLKLLKGSKPLKQRLYTIHERGKDTFFPRSKQWTRFESDPGRTWENVRHRVSRVTLSGYTKSGRTSDPRSVPVNLVSLSVAPNRRLVANKQINEHGWNSCRI